MLTRDQFSLTLRQIKTGKMFSFQLLSVILTVSFVWSLSQVEERIVSNGLSDLLRAFTDQTRVLAYEAGQQKREALEVSDDERQAPSFFGPFDLYRANHYWTRKRGRDNYNTTETDFDTSRWVNPGVTPVSNNLNNKEARKKRDALEQFLGLKKIISRVRREEKSEVEQEETSAIKQVKEVSPVISEKLLGTNAGSIESSPKASFQGLVGSSESLPKAPLQIQDENTKRKKPENRFRRKYLQP